MPGTSLVLLGSRCQTRCNTKGTDYCLPATNFLDTTGFFLEIRHSFIPLSGYSSLFPRSKIPIPEWFAISHLILKGQRTTLSNCQCQIKSLKDVTFTLPSRCDLGFRGTECQPENPLPSTIMSDFENPDSLKTEWQETIGGEIVKPEEGCGVISSGSSLYFNKVLTGDGRMRKARTVGLNGAWCGRMAKKREVAESCSQYEKCIKQHSCALQVKNKAIKRDRERHVRYVFKKYQL